MTRVLFDRVRGERFRHCIYCGRWSHGRACSMHRDLIQIDPKYTRVEAA